MPTVCIAGCTGIWCWVCRNHSKIEKQKNKKRTNVDRCSSARTTDGERSNAHGFKVLPVFWQYFCYKPFLILARFNWTRIYRPNIPAIIIPVHRMNIWASLMQGGQGIPSKHGSHKGCLIKKSPVSIASVTKRARINLTVFVTNKFYVQIYILFAVPVLSWLLSETKYTAALVGGYK